MRERECKIPDCGRPAGALGWCRLHYRHWLRHGDPLAGRRYKDRDPRFCSVPGCGREHHAKGWCSVHYERWKHHGHTARVLFPRSELDAQVWDWVQTCEDFKAIHAQLERFPDLCLVIVDKHHPAEH